MATSIDQQFIEYIVKSLVGNPDEVKIERRIDEKGVLLELTVSPDDLGRVIGKRGATAQSLRTLLRALGTKNDARYNLKIIDVGGPRPPRTEDTTASSPAPSSSNDSTDSSEDVAVDDKPKDKPKAKAPEVEIEPEEKESDLASRTRAELADLDDLDV
jgi:predicted RNA-binding protein YlqC (UPF0109 family)